MHERERTFFQQLEISCPTEAFCVILCPVMFEQFFTNYYNQEIESLKYTANVTQ